MIKIIVELNGGEPIDVTASEDCTVVVMEHTTQEAWQFEVENLIDKLIENQLTMPVGFYQTRKGGT
jgi:tRNA(Phe) wybutosine-synthesizing methylase Tyw3